MQLAQQLTDYVNAAFSGIYLVSHEPDEAEREIIRHARDQQWKVAVWDVANGIRIPTTAGAQRQDAAAGAPLAALRSLPALAEPNGTSLLILHNFHRFLTSPEVIQTAFSQLVAGKQQRTFIVVISPILQLPVELERLFVVLHHDLPGRDQLEPIARELTSDEPGGLPAGNDLQR